jgi:hypothetical protein
MGGYPLAIPNPTRPLRPRHLSGAPTTHCDRRNSLRRNFRIENAARKSTDNIRTNRQLQGAWPRETLRPGRGPKSTDSVVRCETPESRMPFGEVPIKHEWGLAREIALLAGSARATGGTLPSPPTAVSRARSSGGGCRQRYSSAQNKLSLVVDGMARIERPAVRDIWDPPHSV